MLVYQCLRRFFTQVLQRYFGCVFQNDNMVVLWAYLCILVFTKSVLCLEDCVLLCVAESPLISRWLPAKSGAALRYGPWVLILVQMIDSLEGKTTGLALWLAVTTLSHSVTRKGCNKNKGESNKSTSGVSDDGNRRKKCKNQNNVGLNTRILLQQ